MEKTTSEILNSCKREFSSEIDPKMGKPEIFPSIYCGSSSTNPIN
jgi:hypothetical protein